MNGFERRREAKKVDILAAAFELFSKKGIKEATIAEIAKQAGVSQVSIYNFFENKENLARQSFYYFMDIKMHDIQMIMQSNLCFHEKYNSIVQASIEAAESINEEFFEGTIVKDPEVEKFLEEYGQSKTIPLYRNLIAQGKLEGVIDRSLSDEAILLYINAISGVLMTDIDRKTRFELGNLFFYGLYGNCAYQR